MNSLYIRILVIKMEEKWKKVEKIVEEVSGKEPDGIDAVLFLIGIQELGQGVRAFSKEEKQDLMHIGICKIFSLEGYYSFTHTDDQGWPHYKCNERVPYRKMFQQDDLVKEFIVKYFESIELI